MPFPDDPEHNAESPDPKARKRFGSRVMRFLLGDPEIRQPVVEQHDFTRSDPEGERFYTVHYERYGTRRPFTPGALLPELDGDVTVVGVPSHRNTDLRTYYLAFGQRGEEGDLETEFVCIQQKYLSGVATPTHIVEPSRVWEAERVMTSVSALPMGSETFIVLSRSLDELLETIEPEEFSRPEPRREAVDVQRKQLDILLRLASHRDEI